METNFTVTDLIRATEGDSFMDKMSEPLKRMQVEYMTNSVRKCYPYGILSPWPTSH